MLISNPDFGVSRLTGGACEVSLTSYLGFEFQTHLFVHVSTLALQLIG
jgi:hypothetical protein